MMIKGLLHAWNRNLDYGQRLVADLDEDQMIAQPSWLTGPPMNHPAWIFSHLNAYLPIIAAVIEDRAFEDPKDHRFGMHSAPEMTQGIYATRARLVRDFVDGHEQTRDLLESSTDEILARPIRLPRWEPIFGTAGVLLPYLMLNHENGHLGQLSAWRRAMGLPAV